MQFYRHFGDVIFNRSKEDRFPVVMVVVSKGSIGIFSIGLSVKLCYLGWLMG